VSDAIKHESPLKDAWAKKGQIQFHQWVLEVAEALNNSDLSLEGASKAIGVNPAEIEAVIQLAFLDEADLSLLSSNPPPPTTWFLLAQMDRVRIEKAMIALGEKSIGIAPSTKLKSLVDGANVEIRVDDIAKLTPEVFKHLADKAGRYASLTEKERTTLSSFGRYRKSHDELTAKQAVWAEGMILNMIDQGAIKRGSTDGDDELCDSILKIFGR